MSINYKRLKFLSVSGGANKDHATNQQSTTVMKASLAMAPEKIRKLQHDVQGTKTKEADLYPNVTDHYLKPIDIFSKTILKGPLGKSSIHMEDREIETKQPRRRQKRQD